MARVVLTADRTLMSEYQNNMFFGFSASFPKKFMPSPVYYRMFAPSIPHRGGEALYAPYALRKMEAALLADGLEEDQVVVAHPSHLGRFIDRDTKVLAVSAMDPLGYGPVTSTFTNIYRNPAHVPEKFREVVTDPAVRRHRPKIIVGGPGAWQLNKWPDKRKEYGIDCVVEGEGELTLPRLVRMVERGEELPISIEGEVVPLERMPNIVKPTINAMVEVARGCGRGCKFCTPTLQKFRCRSLEDILEEVRVNTRVGRTHIYIHAEDVWRYGAKGVRPNPDLVVRLFSEIHAVEGVTRVFPSHGALASVACERNMLKRVSEALEMAEDNYNSYQTGIETGSPALIKGHMRGKVKPFKPDQWPEIVREAFEISIDAHWIPCATMITGLPSETEDDVVKSIELVDDLKDIASGIFPLFFVAMGTLINEKSFGSEDMTALHWEFVFRCWEHNLRYFPFFVKHGGMRNPFWNLVLDRLLIPYGQRELSRYAAVKREEFRDQIEAKLAHMGSSAPSMS